MNNEDVDTKAIDEIGAVGVADPETSPERLMSEELTPKQKEEIALANASSTEELLATDAQFVKGIAEAEADLEAGAPAREATQTQLELEAAEFQKAQEGQARHIAENAEAYAKADREKWLEENPQSTRRL